MHATPTLLFTTSMAFFVWKSQDWGNIVIYGSLTSQDIFCQSEEMHVNFYINFGQCNHDHFSFWHSLVVQIQFFINLSSCLPTFK